MKNIIKSILVIFLLSSVSNAEYCNSNFDCDISKNDKTGELLNLTCMVKNVPIIAEDVFDKNGSLKTYFGTGEDVCDVLDWLDDGKSNLIKVDGIRAEYTRSIHLRMLHKETKIAGGGYVNGVLSLDSDSKTIVYLEDEDGFPIENLPDGNDFSEIMKYHVVHEFFHYIQEGTQIPYVTVVEDEHSWVLEGTAKMFEDIVYDLENPYTFAAYNPIFRTNRDDQIINILQDIDATKTKYGSFIFWKLMQEKCTLDIQKLLINPLGNLNDVANSCSDDIPYVTGDKLAGIFTLYNWAMILYNDMSLLESDESSAFLLHFDVKKINKPKFQGTLDMSSIVGGSIPKYGAKSFLITHETLEGSADMNLTFKSSGLKLVAIRVKGDGSSDVNDKFVMDASNTEYQLTEADRDGGLFVTLVNTTDEAIKVDELKIFKTNENYTELGILYFSGRFYDTTIPVIWDFTHIFAFDTPKYTLDTIAGHASGDRVCQDNIYDNSAIYGDPRLLGSPLFRPRFEEEEYMKNMILTHINEYPNIGESFYIFNLVIDCILEKDKKVLDDISSIDHQGYTDLLRTHESSETYNLKKYSLFRIYYK